MTQDTLDVRLHQKLGFAGDGTGEGKPELEEPTAFPFPDPGPADE